MSIGTEIIQDALQKIGAHSVANPASPEALVTGKNTLMSMLEMWLSKGIVIGFSPLDKPGDELDEPRDTRNGIVCNLAIWLAPDFSNGKVVVTPMLEGLAVSEFNTIQRLYRVVTIPDKVISSTAPRGAGNDRGFRSRAFFRKGETIGN